MMTASIAPIPVTSHVDSDVVSDLARFIDDQARRGCTRIVLAQRVGETHQTVNEWYVAEMLDARSLAHALHATGMREAQTLRESITYGVFAFRADSPAPVGRIVFRVDSGTGGWLGSTDTPDERGITAMLMRHTESSARLSLGHSREIVDQYQTLLGTEHTHHTRLLEQAYARIRVLEGREAEALELREKLQSHSFERDAHIDALRRKDEMRKFALEKLGPVIPILMSKLLGGGSASDNPSGTWAAGVVTAAATAAGGRVGDELVDRFVQSLTPDQLGGVARLLTEEQLAIFSQLYQIAEARLQRTERTASNENGVAAAAPPRPSPTDTSTPANDSDPQPSPKDTTS
jgi:hypothetical protein